jgi:hypothetical protein
MLHERQRVMLRRMAASASPPACLHIAESAAAAAATCSTLRLGCAPQHLFGAELLPERFDKSAGRAAGRTTLVVWAMPATRLC